MSMLNEIKIILTIFKLPLEIKNKILILFIGLNGTPSSNAIKPQMIRSNNDKSLHNGYLAEKIILENDIYTLWRLKILLNNINIFKYTNFRNLCTIYELQIAYFLGDETSEVERQPKINILNQSIINNKRVELFRMFYNIDKHSNYYQHFGTPNYFGTPTSNIINVAIYCGVIKKQ